MRGVIVLALAVLLVGCGQAEKSAPVGGAEAVAPMAPDGRERADAATGEAAPASDPAAPAPSQTQQQGADLAYAYQTSLQLPAARLAGVMDAHVRACQQASAQLCQLMVAARSGDPDSEINGTVSLRAEPTWLRQFMDHIPGDARTAGGKIVSQATTTEDLTRSIVDTEARLRASRALRDRLQRLLETRPGRLADLLEVERELARVQGDIDSTESNLAAMRARVQMSELTLSYASSDKPLRSDTFEPLGRALAGFLGIVVQVIAALIYVLAVVLPLAVVGGAIAWGVLAWRGRRRRKAHDEPPSAANS